MYTKLCHKYRMWPECSDFYDDPKKLLDLGMYSETADELDIAIEMKWVSYCKDGSTTSYWLDAMVSDAVKLYRQKSSEQKYLMQFTFISKQQYKQIDEMIVKTQEQFNEYIDKRTFRKGHVSNLLHKKFVTMNSDSEIYFVMLVWKIESF